VILAGVALVVREVGGQAFTWGQGATPAAQLVRRGEPFVTTPRALSVGRKKLRSRPPTVRFVTSTSSGDSASASEIGYETGPPALAELSYRRLRSPTDTEIEHRTTARLPVRSRFPPARLPLAFGHALQHRHLRAERQWPEASVGS